MLRKQFVVFQRGLDIKLMTIFLQGNGKMNVLYMNSSVSRMWFCHQGQESELF